MIYNSELKPVSILHFPGKGKELFAERVLDNYLTNWSADLLKEQAKYIRYNIITIFTEHLKREDLLLVNQLDSLGIPYINAWDFAPDQFKGKPWNHVYKLYAYKNCIDYLLKTQKTNEKYSGYVLLLDAKDTYILSLDFKEERKSYKSSKVLFNGDKSDYPNRLYKDGGTVKSDFYVYLNAGACYGYKEYISKLFGDAISVIESIPNYDRDDQYMLKELQQRELRRLGVDEHCRIFQEISVQSELVESKNKLDLIVR